VTAATTIHAPAIIQRLANQSTTAPFLATPPSRFTVENQGNMRVRKPRKKQRGIKNAYRKKFGGRTGESQDLGKSPENFHVAAAAPGVIGQPSLRRRVGQAPPRSLKNAVGGGLRTAVEEQQDVRKAARPLPGPVHKLSSVHRFARTTIKKVGGPPVAPR